MPRQLSAVTGGRVKGGKVIDIPDLKFGKLPPLNKPALRLRSILSGTVPDHPPAVDHLAIGGWQMLGNDQYGDCVAVTWANIRRLLSRLAGAEYYPGLDQVIEVYKTQNPAFPTQDDGMYIQQLLEYLLKSGGPDGVLPIAFAKVDHTNEAEVEAAISIFGYLWTGFSVQAANMDTDWRNGRPFDYHPGSKWVGGHSVIVGGYDSDLAGADQTMATWAKETGFTVNGWRNLVDEVWAVIFPENLGTRQFQEGVDREKLAAAYVALTGRVLPLPEPPPLPPADPVDAALAGPLRDWAWSKTIWSRYTKAGKAATAAREWLERKGL